MSETSIPENAEVKTCTHQCSACGEGHYANRSGDFLARCRSCKRHVTMSKNDNLTQEVVVFFDK